VTPGSNYSYTVVMANITATTFRTVKLSVIHYEPIPRRRRANLRRLVEVDELNAPVNLAARCCLPPPLG